MTLALKYRPTLFQDLVGQHSVSQTLSLALDQGKISNAYLFSGLRGSGKTSSARIFARALQCENGPTSTPCGTCDNCKSSLEGRHIDIIELDAASNRKIDDIRDLIEQTKYKPGFGRYKIFIIDEVHMLTKEAFNALLKTLEEPPEFVKFILATTDPLLMPATILSRTQHFRFKKIPYKSVIEHIAHILQKENIPYEEEALGIIARSGSGSLRDTLTLLEQAIIFGDNQISTAGVTEMLGIIDPMILERFFNAILQKDEQIAQEILESMQEYEAEMVIDEMLLFLKDKALTGRFNTTLLNRFFSILAQSKTLLSLNSDGEFVLLLSLLKMQEATKLKDVHSLIASMEQSTLKEIQQLHNTQSLATPAQQNSQAQETRTQVSKTQLQDTQSQKTPQTSKPPFQSLIDLLYDRNQHLGECFEKNILFVSFEQEILTLISLASLEEDKSLLREQFPLIKSFVYQIFGERVSIKFQQNPTPPQPIQNEIQPLREINPSQSQDSCATPMPSTPSKPSQSTQAKLEHEEHPGTPLSPQNFASKHQELLGNIKKHLQVDLATAKRI